MEARYKRPQASPTAASPTSPDPELGPKRKFTILEAEWFLDRALLPIDRAVLWCIAYHADKNGKNSFPAYETIAEESRCSRRAAINAVKKLEDRGHIRKQRRTDKAGDPTSNAYSLVRNRDKGCAARAPPQRTTCTTGSAPRAPELYPSELYPSKKGALPESRTSTARRLAPSAVTSVPSSLRSRMEEECENRGLDMDFHDWTGLAHLMTKHGASEKAILENWRICLDGKVKPPDKMRFFVDDYSKYAEYYKERQCRELDAMYAKDGKVADSVLEVIEKAGLRKKLVARSRENVQKHKT